MCEIKLGKYNIQKHELLVNINGVNFKIIESQENAEIKPCRANTV